MFPWCLKEMGAAFQLTYFPLTHLLKLISQSVQLRETENASPSFLLSPNVSGFWGKSVPIYSSCPSHQKQKSFCFLLPPTSLMGTTGVRHLPPDTIPNKSGRKGENMSLWLSSSCLWHSGEARMKKDSGSEERSGDLLSKSTAVQNVG